MPLDRDQEQEIGSRPREPAGPEVDACPNCGYPIVLCADGQWRHDQVGDAMACALFYQTSTPRAE